MKVFIYERVSSEEQAKFGYSLDAQHRRSFWRGLLQQIVVDVENKGFAVMY